MTSFTLSIFNPNTLLVHRAGIAGLALALEAIGSQQMPFKWQFTEEEVHLNWQGTDRDAFLSLLQHTYQIKDGYLNVPALKLDYQGKYTFTEGVVTTFLQHGKQRQQSKEAQLLSFAIDDAEITRSFRLLEDCYYTRDFKEAFNSKGAFKPQIPLKGHHIPGLVECFIHGAYQESPENFIALVFLPLACHYYQLSGFRSAVVIPEVKNLKQWVKQRQKSSGRTYQDFRSSSAGESGLRFLLQEKILEDNQRFRVNYCEVYQLGKQQWDGSQNYLKQAVFRVKVSNEILDLYNSAFQFFKPQILKNEKGETWLAVSKVLPWLCDNLILGKPWYCGFYEFYKQNKLYERKGLVQMSQYLDPLEQTLFDAVQGAFSSYLQEQIVQATKQGRSLDYPQVTNKIITRLQRPSTQQDFAKTTVDFLSRHRSKATRGVGAEIYQWLHKDNNWKKARDLALLAIASYTGKGKDGTPEVPEEVLDQSLTSDDSEEGFEVEI